MQNSLVKRAVGKVQRMAQGLQPSEREFRKIWSQIAPIPGWLQDDQEKWLFKSARALPDGANLVEIGSFKGRSTCCLGFGCKGSRKRIFAVDTFNGNDSDFHERDFFAEFWRNIESCGLSSYVGPVKGLSHEVAKKWKTPIDFLFIDGSHQYDDVLADFDGFFPYVVPGGLIAFHDVDETWPEVLKAWHEVIKHKLVGTGYWSTIGYGRKP